MRNLVLLLASGHTVRVKLRDDDLTGPLDVKSVCDFLDAMPATAVLPFITNGKADDPEGLLFAYVEDPVFPEWNTETRTFAPESDYQRINVMSPGDVAS
jgi:hypothetical protein